MEVTASINLPNDLATRFTDDELFRRVGDMVQDHMADRDDYLDRDQIIDIVYSIASDLFWDRQQTLQEVVGSNSTGNPDPEGFLYQLNNHLVNPCHQGRAAISRLMLIGLANLIGLEINDMPSESYIRDVMAHSLTNNQIERDYPAIHALRRTFGQPVDEGNDPKNELLDLLIQNTKWESNRDAERAEQLIRGIVTGNTDEASLPAAA